jgi:NADH-quinone oxidoreductase subunit A
MKARVSLANRAMAHKLAAMMRALLADVQGQTPVQAWLPVSLLLVIGFLFAVANIALSIIIGPSRTGPGKEVAYESGMVPTGDARQRFNVRFYIVAMIFLVFDVEIVFFYPWASIFARHVRDSGDGAILLIDMVIFVVILLVAYFYAWGKGVFRWD